MELRPTDPIRALTAFDVAMGEGKSTLRALASRMHDRNCGLLVVERNGNGPSVVSERDIVRALAEGADPDRTWAVDVMARDVLVVSADTSIEDTAELMLEANVRHLLVEDPDDGRIGVVSIRDLLEPLLSAIV